MMAFVRGMHLWPVDSPLKESIMWEPFPRKEVIMASIIPDNKRIFGLYNV